MFPYLFLVTRSILLIIFTSICFSLPIHHPSKGPPPPLLLLISMDGFRHNYLDRLPENETKNFNYFIQNGVKAQSVKNVFPSVTYPNHMTILTGVYPETHGVTQNRFYDPYLNDTFFMKNYYQNLESKWFDNGAEPIWVTNQKGGQNRKSGSLLWPGGIAPVKCIQPKVLPHAYLYNSTQQISYEQRIDYILRWFSDKTDPINLGLVYFPEPDEIGHQYGPESQQVNEEIVRLDKALGYLRSQLKVHNLTEKMNIIITSDHGMVETGTKFVNLDEYLKPSTYTAASHGLNMIIPELMPKKGFETQVKSQLLKLQRNGNLYVYHKDSQQLRDLHYNDNPRIMSIVLEPKKGWIIGTNKSIAEFKTSIGSRKHGSHGYDPGKVDDVHPFFIASGPAFKKGVRTGIINMVDIYSLMCYILEVEPAPNNGSIYNLVKLLSNKPDSNPKTESFVTTAVTFLSVVLLAALIGGIFAIGAVRQSYLLSRRKLQHRVLASHESLPSDRGTHSLLSDDTEDDDEF